jgi:hypothetical protein
VQLPKSNTWLSAKILRIYILSLREWRRRLALSLSAYQIAPRPTRGASLGDAQPNSAVSENANSADLFPKKTPTTKMVIKCMSPLIPAHGVGRSNTSPAQSLKVN